MRNQPKTFSIAITAIGLCLFALLNACQISRLNVGKPAYSWTMTNTTTRPIAEGAEMSYTDTEGQPVSVIWSGLAPAGSQTFDGGQYPIPSRIILKWKFANDTVQHNQEMHLPPSVAGSDKFSGTIEFKFYEKDAFIEVKPVAVKL